LDALGRPFLTLAHNGFQLDGTPIRFPTRVMVDIEGNQSEVRDAIVHNGDALGRVVMGYHYDMLGNRIHQASMEAGERWMLNDVAGNPIRTWDGRGHAFRTEYDALRRPLAAYVRGADLQPADQDIRFERTEYGESQSNADHLNLRSRVFRQFDGAGVVTNMGHNPVTDKDEAYDFKGNLLSSQRQLAQAYQITQDWSTAVLLETDAYTTNTRYDALNRSRAGSRSGHLSWSTSITTPRGSARSSTTGTVLGPRTPTTR
jgi:hypothetical protein